MANTLRLKQPTLYVGTDMIRAVPRDAGLQTLLQRDATPASEHHFAPADPIQLATALTEAIHALSTASRHMQVVLSDVHCRYLTVPRPAGLQRADELTHFLHARFGAVYDNQQGDWQLTHHAAPSANVDLVVGARANVLAALTRAASFCKVTLASIQPEWVCWHTQWQKTLQRGHHWLISGDGNWATIGYMADGQCVSCRSIRLQPDHDWLGLVARHQTLVPESSTDALVWLGGRDAAPMQDALHTLGERLQRGISPWSPA